MEMLTRSLCGRRARFDDMPGTLSRSPAKASCVIAVLIRFGYGVLCSRRRFALGLSSLGAAPPTRFEHLVQSLPSSQKQTHDRRNSQTFRRANKLCLSPAGRLLCARIRRPPRPRSSSSTLAEARSTPYGRPISTRPLTSPLCETRLGSFIGTLAPELSAVSLPIRLGPVACANHLKWRQIPLIPLRLSQPTARHSKRPEKAPETGACPGAPFHRLPT
jgi:hypothetical protein